MKKLRAMGITAALTLVLSGIGLSGCSAAPREFVNSADHASLQLGDAVDSESIIVTGDPLQSKSSIDIIGDISAHSDPLFSNKRYQFHVKETLKAVRISRARNPHIVCDDEDVYSDYFVTWRGTLYKIAADKTVSRAHKVIDARGEDNGMTGGYLTRTEIALGADLAKQREIKVLQHFVYNQDEVVDVNYTHVSNIIADWVENQHAWMFYFSDGSLYRVYGNSKFDVLSAKPVVHQRPDALLFIADRRYNMEVRGLTRDGRDVIVSESSHYVYDTKYESYHWNDRSVDVIARYSETYGTWVTVIEGKKYFVQFSGDSLSVPTDANCSVLLAPSTLQRPQFYAIPNNANTDAPPAVVPGRNQGTISVPLTGSEGPPVVLPARRSDERPPVVIPDRTENGGRLTAVSPRANDDRPSTVIPKRTRNDERPASAVPNRANNEGPAVVIPRRVNGNGPAVVVPGRAHNDGPTAVIPRRVNDYGPAIVVPGQNTAY